MRSNDGETRKRAVTAKRLLALLMCMVMVSLSLPMTALPAAAENTVWSVSCDDSSLGCLFTVSRSGNTSEPVTVKYRTVGLSAYEGQHFTGASGTLSFNADETEKTVEVEEHTPSANAYKFQNGSKRSYRLEVTDMGGFLLAGANRSVTVGTSVPKTGVFDEKTLTFQNTEFLITDAGYINNNYKTVAASSYFGSSVPRAYLQSINAILSMTLSMDVKEMHDGYQYIQVLTDELSSCDTRAGLSDGNPGTMDLSFYMAGFGHDPGDPNNNYATYTFPVGAHGANVMWAWPNNTIENVLYGEKSKNALTSVGGIRLPMDFQTLVMRFNASGSGDDNWYARNVKAHVRALDGERPRIESITVAPGMHARGNEFYVSIAFSELVHNDSVYLYTNWCDSMTCVAGNYSNVLTFKGTIKSGASGPLSITGISSAASDLAGNECPDSVAWNNICSLDASYAYSISVIDDIGDGEQRNSAHTSYSYDTPDFTLTNPTAVTGCRFDGWTGSNGETPQTGVYIPSGSIGNRTYTANWTDFWGVVDGADGSAENPYVISSVQGLLWLQSKVNAGNSFSGVNFILDRDIDMQGVAFSAIGNSLHPFSGVFNGDGKAIKNLTVTGSQSPAGLFGRIEGAEVTGVIIDSATVTSDTYAGALAGYNASSEVSECFVINSTVGGTGEAGAVVGHGGFGSGSDNYARACTVKNAAINTVRTITALSGVTVECADFAPSYQNVTYYPNGSVVTFGFDGEIPVGYALSGSYKVENVSIGTNTFTVPAHDVSSVTPEFSPFDYSVVFCANDGSGQETVQYFVYDVAAPLADCAFDPPAGGFELEKWTTSPDGSGDSYTNGQTVSNLTAQNHGVVTLYAQWRPIPWTGSGQSASDPYVILYPSQFLAMAENVNQGINLYQWDYIRLDADLDMSGISFPGVGIMVGDSVHTFRGEFDGNSHTIYNVTVDRTDALGFAVFNRIDLGGIKNLTVDGASISAASHAAILVYDAGDAYIKNCVVKNSTLTITQVLPVHFGAIVGTKSERTTQNQFQSNYYLNCTFSHNGNTGPLIGGYDGADIDGACGLHTVTLQSGVSAIGQTVTVDGATYFVDGTEVALSGGSYGYLVNGVNVYSSFTMPAEAVTVTALASLILTHFPAVAVTCTEPGNAEYWLGSDGNYYADENGTVTTTEEAIYIPAPGHDWEWARVSDPTCTSAGEDVRICSRCGESESRAIDALGHDFGDGEVCLRGCGAQAQLVDDWTELVSACASDGLVKLDGNITKAATGSYLHIRNNVTVILDLNGHTIDLNQSYITIRENSTLIIRDSSQEQTGEIVNGGDGCIFLNNNFGGSPSLILKSGALSDNHKKTGNGGAVYVQGGTFTMTGGSIYGNTAEDGGGVYKYENAEFILNGGVIRDNTATNAGGGVYAYKAGFSLVNGEISGNTAKNGGGVLANADFTMGEGSAVTGNTASGNGGGVYLESNAVLTINGGDISENVAVLGGGIYTRQQAGVIVQSGTITDNEASSIGGGVYFGSSGDFNLYGGTVTGNSSDKGGGIFCNTTRKISVRGTVFVTGNTKSDGETPNNVFLDSGALIQVLGDLTQGSVIGVTTNVKPAENAPVTLTTGLSSRDPGFIVDDTDEYPVYLSNAGEAVIGVPITYALNVGEVSHGSLAANASEYRAGESVNLTFVPDQGYGTQEVYYVNQYGGRTRITSPTGATECTFLMPKYGVTVYAVFVPIESLVYTIEYVNAKNGTDGVTNPNPISYQSDDEIIIREPVRTYFIFDGWTYPGQTTPVKNVTIPAGSTGDKTFTAHWTADIASWWGNNADGTADNPYQISDPGGLNLLSILVNSGASEFNYVYFELTDDIVFAHGDGENEDNYTPIGNEDHPFRGILEGNGYTISGVRAYKGSNAEDQGLFGVLAGTVRNVVLDDAQFAGLYNVGGIAGYSYGGTIENCTVTSTVIIRCYKDITASGFGGIAGRSSDRILNCRSSVRIEGIRSIWYSAMYIGGIVGSLYNNGEIRNCFADGVTIMTNDTTGKSARFIGAIVGASNNNLYDDYYRNCSVNGLHAGVGIGAQGTVQDSRDEDGKASALFRITAAQGVTLGSESALTLDGYDYYVYGSSIRLADEAQQGYTSGVYVVLNGEGEDVTAETVRDETLGKFLTVPDYDITVTSTRKKLFSNADIVLAAIPDVIYSGESVLPEIILTDGTTPLVEGSDFTVSVSGVCKNVGVYGLTITAAPDSAYYGSFYREFNVLPRSVSFRALDQRVELNGSIDESAQAIIVADGSLVTGDYVSSVTLICPSTEQLTVNGVITPSAVLISDAYGNDVTANYDLSYLPGTLTVYDPSGGDEVIYGDVSGDGAVSGRDATLILQYVANFDEDTGTSSFELEFAAADVNCDGMITGKDATLIKQYVANYDDDTGTSSVELGPSD